MTKSAAFNAGVVAILEKIADIPLAQRVIRPLLGKTTKQLGGVTKVKIPGQGWLTPPPRLAGR